MYVKTNRVVGRMGKVTSLRRFDVRFLVARANNRNRVNTKKNRVRLLRNFRTKRRTHDGFRYTEKCYSFANPITVFFSRLNARTMEYYVVYIYIRTRML